MVHRDLLGKFGNNKNYLECCGTYINGLKLPETPEQLMRFHYTAYAMANIKYIVKTMQGRPLKCFNAKKLALWPQNLAWQKLEVLNNNTRNNKGFVEFKAHYIDNGQNVILHEISEFKRKNGQWFYINEQIL